MRQLLGTPYQVRAPYIRTSQRVRTYIYAPRYAIRIHVFIPGTRCCSQGGGTINNWIECLRKKNVYDFFFPNLKIVNSLPVRVLKCLRTTYSKTEIANPPCGIRQGHRGRAAKQKKMIAGEQYKTTHLRNGKRSQNTASSNPKCVRIHTRAYNIWYHTVRQHSTEETAEATNGGHSKQPPPNQRGQPRERQILLRCHRCHR